MSEKEFEECNQTHNFCENYDLLTKTDMDMLDQITNNILSLCGDQLDTEHTIQIWGYLSDRLYKARYRYIEAIQEIEQQKCDLEHFSLGLTPGTEEYNEILEGIGKLVRERRTKKNISAYLLVAQSNLGKICGFLRGMGTRTYTPKSKKYGASPTHTSTSETTVKIGNILPPTKGMGR